MKFVIYKSKNINRKSHHEYLGEIDASSIEVASDMLFKRLRRNTLKVHGQMYIILPYSNGMQLEKHTLPSLHGLPFRIVQYREGKLGL